MIKTIVKSEIKNYLKNPIYYIGAILVFISVYSSVSPYLKLQYYTEESQLRGNEAEVDILDGYIPTTKEEQYQNGYEIIYNTFVDSYDMQPEEVTELIKSLQDMNMSYTELDEYLVANYSYYNAAYGFEEQQIKKGTLEEINAYIKTSFVKESYTDYFSRIYVDYFALNILFYAIIMFAFLYIKDSKKDIYELLHTKPLKAWQYVAGKILGGMAAISLVVLAVTSIFEVLAIQHGLQAGFPVSIWSIWFAVLLFVIPGLFMVISVFTGISILFKNPLPGIPLLFLYMLYSNFPSYSAEAVGNYSIRKLVLLIRYQMRFFETSISIEGIYNQISLLIVGAVIIGLSVFIWKRRRVY